MAAMRMCPFCARQFEGGPTCPNCAALVPESPPSTPSDPTSPTAPITSEPGYVPSPDLPAGPLEPVSCRICGGAPAAQVTFRQGVGMVLLRQTTTATGPFCRDCGLSFGRSYTNRTLLTGWWGVISFFLNWVYLIGNVNDLRRLGGLPSPTGGEPARRLDRGRPLYLRAGTAVLAVLIGLLGWGAIDAMRSPSSGGTTYVGQCVVLGEKNTVEEILPCSRPHDGKIISSAASEAACPAAAETFLQDGANANGAKPVLCVDDDA